ncbi:MAG: hypothetical protein U0350_48735 [Caldilineaceae bacterium]
MNTKHPKTRYAQPLQVLCSGTIPILSACFVRWKQPEIALHDWLFLFRSCVFYCERTVEVNNNNDSPIDLEIKAQIQAFNQSLLNLAAQQYQAIRQTMMVQQWELSNQQAGQLPKIGRRQSRAPSLMHNAITSARHWLIEKLLALEEDNIPELPLPEGKDVIVIQAIRTDSTFKRKDEDHGTNYSIEHRESADTADLAGSGTAQGSAQSDPGCHNACDQRGCAVAADRGEHGSYNTCNRSVRD